MSIKTALAGAPSFAHLIGFGRARAEDDKPNDENDERKQREDESDEDYAKRMKALDEKEEEEAKKAEEEEERARAEEEERKKEEEARGRGRAEDENDDEAKKAKRAEARGRLAERARGAAIFGCPAAATRPDLAAQLAFKTSMSADEAIGVLTAAATGAPRGGIADRMAVTRVPNVGSDASAPSGDDSKSMAARIVAAGKKRRGEA